MMSITRETAAPEDTKRYGGHSMIAPLRRALVALTADELTEENWRTWEFEGKVPDVDTAIAEQEQLFGVLRDQGVELEYLNEHAPQCLQRTVTFDPALITDEGAVMMNSGRPERRPETWPMARRLLELEIPIIGWIRGEGHLDAGDTCWLDHDTLLVGRGYRTDDEGIRQLRHILDGLVDNVIDFEMPHWWGPRIVLHLLSLLGLVDGRTAVIYPRATPVRLMRLLQERGYRLIETTDEEFITMGAVVLALEPGVVVMVSGNPVTAARLRDAGIKVIEYDADIGKRRYAGPVCNTRPLLRSQAVRPGGEGR